MGELKPMGIDSNSDTISNLETLNSKKNYYHKPQFSLRDFWAVNDKLYISNIAYISIGQWWWNKS